MSAKPVSYYLPLVIVQALDYCIQVKSKFLDMHMVVVHFVILNLTLSIIVLLI